MLIQNEDGKSYTVGPLDVLCILRDLTTGRYHVCFFEEKPMPGPVPSFDEVSFVRLKSKMHHTEGAETLEGAKVHLAEMRESLIVRDENVSEEPLGWDGEIGMVWPVSNWRHVCGDCKSLDEALRPMGLPIPQPTITVEQIDPPLDA